MDPKIIYRTRSASLKDIIQHLNSCSGNFFPPLNEKTDIDLYAKKIAEYAVTFEAWGATGILAGLVAVYYNDPEKITGFITNVSTINEYSGRGIASELISMSINYGRHKGYKHIMLEVGKENIPAIRLYKKFMFNEEQVKGEVLFMKHQIIKEIND